MKQDADGHAGRIARLVNGYRLNYLSEQDRAELDTWINDSKENKVLFEELINEAVTKDTQVWLESLTPYEPQKRKRNAVIKRIAWAAAASVIIAAGIKIFTPANESSRTVPVATIEPGKPKATLTTNTTTITLDEIRNQHIKIDDKSQALAGSTVLIYTRESEVTLTHTLSTPAGGEFKLVLPDGTKVWLNAKSNITYPTRFGAARREVVIEGELYFEVNHDSKRPFSIKQNENEIEVLGTKFNVKAYDEDKSEISLIEGKIKLQTPTQQAILTKNQKVTITGEKAVTTNDENISDDIAWTTGLFRFRQTPIHEVMQQISRWYDVDVKYATTTRKTFTGSIMRNSSIEQVLEILQLSAGTRFTIQGKTITISSQ